MSTKGEERRWRAAGFGPEEAAAQRAAGVSAGQASVLRALLRGPA